MLDVKIPLNQPAPRLSAAQKIEQSRALKANEEAVEIILEAIEKAGYKANEDVALALDPAASEFYDEEEKVYHLRTEGRKLSSQEMVAFWVDWVNKYPIVSIEDGLAQDDWEALIRHLPPVGVGRDGVFIPTFIS
jgi:enolase